VEALYLALVDARALSLAELARLDALPEDELPAALATLEAQGLIHELPGEPRRYSAVDPELGLVALIAAKEQAASRARAAARQLTERFRAARRGKDPLDVIDVVVGREAEGRRFDQLLRLASTELRGFDKPPYLYGPARLNDTLLERLAEGIGVRVLYDRVALDYPGVSNAMRRCRDAGEEQRALSGVPLKMVIADDKLALIRLTGEPTTASSSLYVHPSALLDGLSQLFETLWRSGTPLHAEAVESCTMSTDRPSPDETTLLGLLAAGLTDEAIARHLGIGLRTAQRQLRQLLVRLGVETRFQAGVQAKARNWL
jgi:sugar-specific transcriptional regulator TrmB/DNA-binding CsgD family transcriptional regulator